MTKKYIIHRKQRYLHLLGDNVWDHTTIFSDGFAKFHFFLEAHIDAKIQSYLTIVKYWHIAFSSKCKMKSLWIYQSIQV